MNSLEIFEAIQEIASTSSKLEKERLVKKYAADETFCKVLDYTLNPFKTYGIAKRPETIGEHGGNEFDSGTWELLNDLISRKVTGTTAIEYVRGEMTALSKESAELFWRIIKKDLRAGFGESTVNKAVKGLIPEFPYQRCSLPKDAKLETWPWADGVFSQEKADGMFANVDHEASGLVSIRSRQGTEFPMDKFVGVADDIRTRTRPGHQHHGEFLVLRDGVVCPREDGNGVMNHVLSGGDFAANEKPVFMVWDQIPLSAVVSKGKHEVPYGSRLAGLVRQLRDIAGTSVMLIPTKVVKSLAEARIHAGMLMKLGKEGTIIKHPKAIWKDGTSKEQIKIKLEFEVDLQIIGINLGSEGTKTAGRAGAFECATSDGLLRVNVTVKNEAMRDAVDADEADWVGRIIAVTANDIMKPSDSNEFHSLFLPRMSEARYRTDKTVADTLQRVLDQKEAAIYGNAIMKEAA